MFSWRRLVDFASSLWVQLGLQEMKENRIVEEEVKGRGGRLVSSQGHTVLRESFETRWRWLDAIEASTEERTARVGG